MPLIFYLLTNITPACRGMDPTLFVGPDGEERSDRKYREAVAKDVCRQCELRTKCLAWALENQAVGVWGGMTDDERSVILNSQTPHRVTTQQKSRIERQLYAIKLHEQGAPPADIAAELCVTVPTVNGYLKSQRTSRRVQEGSDR